MLFDDPNVKGTPRYLPIWIYDHLSPFSSEWNRPHCTQVVITLITSKTSHDYISVGTIGNNR